VFPMLPLANGYSKLPTLFASRTVLVLEILGFKFINVAPNGARCCTAVASILPLGCVFICGTSESFTRTTGWGWGTEVMGLRALYHRTTLGQGYR